MAPKLETAVLMRAEQDGRNVESLVWVINGPDRAENGTSEVSQKADIHGARWYVSKVPCVDGSVLARAFFTFAALVGAAMCSAY